jgi:hypothetical protein
MSHKNDVFCSSGMQNANLLGDEMNGGMIMYMDGFRFSLSSSAMNPCLNLYFPSWTLNTRSKFLWAMFGIVMLSIFTEGVSKLRSVLSRRLTGTAKRWIMALIHGVQALVGYILMLAAMTFSVELLACIIFGLGTGFAMFYDDEDNHVTTNPVCVQSIIVSSIGFHPWFSSFNYQCCNFIQEEFKERIWNLRHEQNEESMAIATHDLSVPLLSKSNDVNTYSEGVI